MRNLKLAFSITVASWALMVPLVRAQARDFQLSSGDVIAFLGGTNLVNLQRAGQLETLLTAAFVDSHPKFRDMAWEGDTVFQQGTVIERWREDKFGDLSEQLRRNHINVVFAQFGQMEALQGPDQLPAFTTAYSRLIKILKEDGRDVILLTPTPYEKTGNELLPDLSSRNTDLAAYVAAMRELAAQHDCRMVDLYSACADVDLKLTNNGIHLTADAHNFVAQAIARELLQNVATDNLHADLRRAVVRKHQLWMDYWRPANWKCLFGDDGEREFGKASNEGLTLRQEWNTLPALIEKSEQQIWKLAQ